MNPGLFDTYAGAMQWLFEHVDLERRRRIAQPEQAFRLDRTRAILKELGNPHDELRTVHIAGTKGKGSTVAMLAAALTGCGWTVGQYTSPHLIDVRERIRIGTRDISENQLRLTLCEVARAAASAGIENLHFFEILTAAALYHFALMAVDLAIMEVGLGGRLDATNVILPEVCAITQISYDHMEILGHELDAIAREKAGIFKPGVPAVSTPQDPQVEAALRAVARQVGAPLRFLEQEIEFTSRAEVAQPGKPNCRISLETPRTMFDHVLVPFKGEHQALNCGLVLAIVDALRERGDTLAENAVVDGLAHAAIAGRFEQVCNDPRIIIDGAHNALSIAALMRTLPAHAQYDSLVVIFGCGRDKDIDGMLNALATGADKVIFTRSRLNPRAHDAFNLARRFAQLSDKMAHVALSLEEAIDLARRAVNRADVICITGSFYLVGEARKMFVAPEPG